MGEGRSHQVVKLNGGDTLVDPRDDFLGNGSSIDMVGIKSITQPGNASGDLVELNPLLAAIYVGEISRSIIAEAGRRDSKA